MPAPKESQGAVPEAQPELPRLRAPGPLSLSYTGEWQKRPRGCRGRVEPSWGARGSRQDGRLSCNQATMWTWGGNNKAPPTTDSAPYSREEADGSGKREATRFPARTGFARVCPTERTLRAGAHARFGFRPAIPAARFPPASEASSPRRWAGRACAHGRPRPACPRKCFLSPRRACAERSWRGGRGGG